MKKTLHGKRHLRSRVTVQIGRDRRRIKKFMTALEKYPVFVQQMVDRVVAMAEAVNNFQKAVAMSFGVPREYLEDNHGRD